MKKILYTIWTFLLFATPTFAENAEKIKEQTGNWLFYVFKPGQPGFVVTFLIGLAVGSWILEEVAKIIGKSAYANWIKLISLFVGLSIFFGKAIIVIKDLVKMVLN